MSEVEQTGLNKEITVPTHLQASKIVSYVLYAWVTVGITLLGLRVFLLAFSANAATPFVSFVYRTSADYLAPFRGIFPPREIGETGYFDIAALFAIVIYLLLAWLVGALISHIQYRINKNLWEQKAAIRTAEQAKHNKKEVIVTTRRAK